MPFFASLYVLGGLLTEVNFDWRYNGHQVMFHLGAFVSHQSFTGVSQVVLPTRFVKAVVQELLYTRYIPAILLYYVHGYTQSRVFRLTYSRYGSGI